MTSLWYRATHGFGSMIGGVIFVVVAGILLGAGSLFWWNTSRQMRNWESTTGTVVDFEHSSDGDGGTITMPVVEYRTRHGEIVRARPYQERNSDVDAGWYDIGDEVEVFYNPENPEDMFINDFMHVWFAPALMGGLGILFGAIGGVWVMAAGVGMFFRRA